MEKYHNLDTTELQAKDNLVVHPWENFAKAGHQERTVIGKGDGVYVYDSDGRKLLDGPAGIVVCECRLWARGDRAGCL